MTAKARLGVVGVCAFLALCALALVGVTLAAKPVAWMPTLFVVYLASLLAGVGWALVPAFSAPDGFGTPPFALAVGVVGVVCCAASFLLFFALWFTFGGHL